MISLKIHDHALKHGIAKEDIVHAWTNPMAMRRRTALHEGEIVAIGPDIVIFMR